MVAVLDPGGEGTPGGGREGEAATIAVLGVAHQAQHIHTRPYSVTTADLSRLRRELAHLPPRVTRIHVIRDDNDGARDRADFGNVTAALDAVGSHMTRPGVYSIMITFDE